MYTFATWVCLESVFPRELSASFKMNHFRALKKLMPCPNIQPSKDDDIAWWSSEMMRTTTSSEIIHLIQEVTSDLNYQFYSLKYLYELFRHLWNFESRNEHLNIWFEVFCLNSFFVIIFRSEKYIQFRVFFSYFTIQHSQIMQIYSMH